MACKYVITLSPQLYLSVVSGLTLVEEDTCVLHHFLERNTTVLLLSYGSSTVKIIVHVQLLGTTLSCTIHMPLAFTLSMQVHPL